MLPALISGFGALGSSAGMAGLAKMTAKSKMGANIGGSLFGRQKNPLQPTISQGMFAPAPGSTAEVNPLAREAQQQALGQLGKISEEGFTESDKAALNRIQREEENYNKSQQGALKRSFESRGMGGSGANLQAELQQGQQSANRLSDRGMDVAALGRQRALQAMSTRGQLAGEMTSEDLGAQKMRDYANQFNASSLNNYLSNLNQMKNQRDTYNTDYRRKFFDRGMSRLGLGSAKATSAGEYR